MLYNIWPKLLTLFPSYNFACLGYVKLNSIRDIRTILFNTLYKCVAEEVHANTTENIWSVLKRCLYGVYHQVGDKHQEILS